MADEPEDPNGDAGSTPSGEARRIHDDPDEVDEDGRYDERSGAARESANPDDHRDEEPHS